MATKQRVRSFKQGRLDKPIDIQINEFLERNPDWRISITIQPKYISYTSRNNDSEHIERVLVVFEVETKGE